MKLIAAYIVYNEAPFLAMSLSAINGLVDEVLIVDGCFEGFEPEANGASYDGTLKVIKKFPFKQPLRLIEAQTPWKSEMDKLNQWWQFADEDDWLLELSADEIVLRGLMAYRCFPLKYKLEHQYRDLDVVFTQNLNTYFYLPNDVDFGVTWYPKLIHVKPGIHFAENHYTLRDKDGGQIPAPGKYTNDPDIEILHLHHLRSPERLKMRNEYDNWRFDHERGVEKRE